MQKPTWKVIKTKPDAVIPNKRIEDSGYDVYTTQKKSVLLLPNEQFMFDTGLSMSIDNGWGICFWEKGGFGNKGLS
ncbi:MAG TPA: hypothetical protein GX708_23150, partial [Gallicola sp.]|nr:hypothetical protein [Gallicola sp.]